MESILIIVMFAFVAGFLGYLIDESRRAVKEEAEEEEAKIEANVHKFQLVPTRLWQSTCTAETPKSGAKHKIRARFAGNEYLIIVQFPYLIGDERAVVKINGQDIFDSRVAVHSHGDHPAWRVYRLVAKEVAAARKT